MSSNGVVFTRTNGSKPAVVDAVPNQQGSGSVASMASKTEVQSQEAPTMATDTLTFPVRNPVLTQFEDAKPQGPRMVYKKLTLRIDPIIEGMDYTDIDIRFPVPAENVQQGTKISQQVPEETMTLLKAYLQTTIEQGHNVQRASFMEANQALNRDGQVWTPTRRDQQPQ